MLRNSLLLIFVTAGVRSEILGGNQNVTPKCDNNKKYEGEKYELSELFNMFGSRSRLNPWLRDDSNWVPPCEASIIDQFAANSIIRAKTDNCKRELTEVACMLANNILVPDHIPSSCPAFKQNLDLVKVGGQHIGCFRDKDGTDQYRLLPDFVRRPIQFLTRDYCVRQCSQSGYPYAGLEYGHECWCGLTPPNPTNVDHEECSMPCTGGGVNCGGRLAISVYFTGVEVDRQITTMEKVNQTRIVFFLSVYGRDIRQIRRLLRLIYRPHHYYYIHVDINSPWLIDQLRDLDTLENVKFASKRFNVFWGSNNLMYMMLVSFKEMLEIENWQFHFVMRISESDFPTKPVEELEKHLSTRIGQNFLSGYRTKNGEFDVQGLAHAFHSCESHMYRIGKTHLPWGIQWGSGSNWFTISKSFMNYLVYSDDLLVRNLLHFFQYKMVAGESFFHTVILNSRFCQTRINENLRYINWGKDRDCSCTRNIDWCACSPHYMTSKDQAKIQTELRLPNVFFARKFSPVADLGVINQLEQLVSGSSCSVCGGSGWSSHWLNSYNSQQDVEGDNGHLLARVSSLLVGVEPLEITSYFRDNNYQGELVLYRMLGGGREEILVQPDYKINLWSHEGRNVIDVQITPDYKPEYGNYSTSTPLLILPSSNLSLVVWFGSPPISGVPFHSIKYQMYNETGVNMGEAVNLVTNLQSFHIINIDRLHQDGQLTPGVWSVSISDNDVILATLSFLVICKDRLQEKEHLVKTFYKPVEKCHVEQRGKYSRPCSETSWSSFSPDPKTTFV